MSFTVEWFKGPGIGNRDRQMIDRAVGVALTSKLRHRHGAIVYKSGRVLDARANLFRNQHPSMGISVFDYTTHAEVAALRGLSQELVSNSTVYVVRINHRGEPKLSLPCPACIEYCYQRGVKRIVHT